MREDDPFLPAMAFAPLETTCRVLGADETGRGSLRMLHCPLNITSGSGGNKAEGKKALIIN